MGARALRPPDHPRMRALSLGVALLAGTCGAGCGGAATAGAGPRASPPPPPDAPARAAADEAVPPATSAGDGAAGWAGEAQRPADPAEEDLAFCVDETNRYRTKAGRPALQRSPQLEAFAAEAARTDSRLRRPHHHFSTVTYPYPYREMGENVIPWWPIRQHGSVRDIIRYGLAGMWDEGPGGGHYENLVGIYTLIGCAIHVENGEATLVQDFLLPPG